MGRRKKQESHRTSKNPRLLIPSIFNRQRDLPIAKRSVVKTIEALLAYLCRNDLKNRVLSASPFPEDSLQISIYFVTEAKISQLHKEFFGDPTPTDCISFPLDQDHLGEVFISPKAALQYNPKNPYQELTLYLVHGVLHLIGYDDLDPVKRKEMRKKEKLCIRQLSNKNRLIQAP